MSDSIDTQSPSSKDTPETAARGMEALGGWLMPLVRRGYRLTLLLALLVTVFRVVNLFDVTAIWDDAYIFQTYCRNLLAGHGWSWHSGGEPTYGTTSLLFVLPATLLRAITGNSSLAAMLGSVSGGLLFVGVLGWSLYRGTSEPSVRAARASGVLALLLFALWCAKSAIAHHFTSGLDTTWALAFVAGYFWLAVRLAEHQDRRSAAWLGIMGGLAFAMRPDLLVFCFGIPAFWLLFDFKSPLRPLLFQVLAISVVMTLGQLAFNAWYFQSALPLPFYAKSLGLYGGSLKRAYRAVSSEYVAQFSAVTWPMLVVIGVDLVAAPRRWWRQAAALERAILATALFFLAYYWIVALPVMGFHQRFYQPLIIPIAWLARMSMGRWCEQLFALDGTDADAVVTKPAPHLRFGAAIAGAFGLLMCAGLLWPEVSKHGPAFARSMLRRGLRFDVYKHAKDKGPRSYWYKLDEVSALPNEVVFAATEVGMLSEVNRERRVIDIAGLNEREFALSPFSAERLLGEYRPDLIYMPHNDYKNMREAMTTSKEWENYEWFDYHRLRTKAFGVAIRRDSDHYEQMRELFPGLRSVREAPRLRGDAAKSILPKKK